MRAVLGGRFRVNQRRGAITALTALAICWLYFPLSAQHQGPIAPPAGVTPPPSDPKPKSTPAVPAAGPMSPPPVTSLGAPTIPVDEIIQKFAAREAEFKTERENYTYTQTFIAQTLDDNGRVDGEYRMVTDIVFTPAGKRYEKDVYRPVPTLDRLQFTQEDFNDLENLYPFVLTTEDLPKYEVKYVDHVPLDELTTYVFDMAPKTTEKNQRYFKGRIWVDDKDFQIVKTFGQPVGYVKKKKNTDEALFPHFETFRENIEGKYWFPTYTRADEVLPFKDNPVHLRVTVRYENYKRFGVTVKIGKPTETDKNKQ